MRKRMAVIACGLLLAVVGVQAPAYAGFGETCGNLVEYGETPTPIIIARTCISWNDDPAGSKWTHYQSKVWNPPVMPYYYLTFKFYYNNGVDGGWDSADNNETKFRYPSTIGQLTAKFDIRASGLPGAYCMYMVPGGYHQEHHACV